MSIVGDLQEELRNALLKLAYASSESIAPIAEGLCRIEA